MARAEGILNEENRTKVKNEISEELKQWEIRGAKLYNFFAFELV